MATYITDRKTTCAAVVPSLHHGLLVLRIAEEGVYFRQKGRKKAFLLPHGRAFQLAVDLHVQRERADRKASRTKRKR